MQKSYSGFQFNGNHAINRSEIGKNGNDPIYNIETAKLQGWIIGRTSFSEGFLGFNKTQK